MKFTIRGSAFEQCRLFSDSAPPKELVDRVIVAVGEKARDAMKVEVPFTEMLAAAGLTHDLWWENPSKDLLEIPLGPRGAVDIQSLQLGTALAHHALIVGRPGSGKTVLMHVIITALSLKYSPAELELYLIDFKKGVGFKAYADHGLPHARVIAIESEREFGISVLRGLDKELTRRGELFRAANGAEKLSEYRERTGEVMPRVVLIADEFQEFFTIEDAMRREAALLLDRIVRQGRAFGIHIILGSQTLAGSHTIDRSTADQISVRIALQCSDHDSRLILGDDNPGARFLSRAGEAIYNAENGQVQANKLFQVAMYSEEDKAKYLPPLRQRAGSSARQPIVFEGHLPARLEWSPDAIQLAHAVKPNPRRGVNAWLGEPIAIDVPTHGRLRRQAGGNLLVISRDEEQGIGVVASALTTLALQHSEDDCRFIVADYSMVDAAWSDYLADFCELLPQEAKLVKRRQVPDAVKEVLREVEARQGLSTAPATNLFFVVFGVQRARELRKDEDDFSSDSIADEFHKVLRDGPEVGVHCILWGDTPLGLTRTLGRKALVEFSQRAVGVLSPDDSQAVIEDASAARIDRPHRMLLFDEERPGQLQKFRPFSLPPLEWVRSALLGQVEGN